MRGVLTLITCLGLVGCQPKPPEAPAGQAETAAQAPPAAASWTMNQAGEAATLVIFEPGMDQPFTLACRKAGPTLSASASVKQVALANTAPPFALVLSATTFVGELGPGGFNGPVFTVSTPLTAEALTALSGAVTARISVNDGYAFAESAVDPGAEFETFAAACAQIAGLSAPQ